MKKVTLFMVSAYILISCTMANQPTQEVSVVRMSDEEVVRLIADHVLEQPVTQFVGVTTGVVYNSTDEIPEGEDVRFKSPLMEWHYSAGVTNMAIIKLGKYLEEQKYIDYALDHVAFGFANYQYFKERFRGDRNHWHWPYGQLWNFEELDDCGAMGASVIDVYAINPQERYLEYIKNSAEHILNGQVRTENGTLSRTFPRNMTIWADDLYMSVSFLARMGSFTNDEKYFNDAIHQVIKMDQYLWDPIKQLYYHCYYTDLERNGVAYWGRANGWITFAICDLLDELPSDHPKRDLLISILEKQIVGYSRYQDADGMWKQLLDKPDSYQESSVTALFIYGVAKAVNEGWIDPDYASIARRGWHALKRDKITPEGKFIDVCVGTGISDDLVFYYTRPVGDNEKHGIGLILNAGLEMIKLNKDRN
ncbi:glycoside hydrolase family 88/105 protein [Alkalitalea saponilacus]|uniref:Rhamnogalacturonyl hydrolase YesR n=1 Tax=Alkalitalea saponilacus TaxID=889453 RepID=A0A1T5HTF8_9BACT|nr:glycoside hydrolase family 88 protein [Alkalitalea saponilacus]SKC23944.1 Rhamnogalacturonyl hydrolase YesR [Alkalitalea saponilacus]